MVNEIFAVIVIYNVKLYYSNTYKTLLKEAHLSFMVYDNSQLPQHSELEFSKEILYFHDKENSGLSKAYNIAAKYAKEHDFKWLLLLDQDTAFPKNAIDNYINAIRKNSEIKMFAPILKLSNGISFSPVSFFLKRGYASKHIVEGIQRLSSVSPVNSGILVYINAFLTVGGYNEKVFLDFADFQFTERFSKHYPIFYLLNITCTQDFSNEETDTYKLIKRFEIYCKCALACERRNLYDSFCYFYIVLRRTVGLTIRTHSFVFLKTFLKKYFA